MSRAGEFEWISRYLAPLAAKNSFSLQDDAAILTVPTGQELVVTQDAIFENIHFLPSDPLDTVAQKALRVNVSDIVAKGAAPCAYSLALGVPDRWQDADMALFCEGLAKDQSRYGIQLTGGDTYRSPDHLCVAVTMFGAVGNGHYKSRLGAQVGDLIVVSGTIGNAAIGLMVAQQKLTTSDDGFFIDAYRLPNPPLDIASLIEAIANASMDVSDGLLGDCTKLCKASNVDAVINRENVPLVGEVKTIIDEKPELWPVVWGGGDDFQCLCTIPADKCSEFQQAAQSLKLSVTVIGEITGRGTGNVSLLEEGVPVSSSRDSFSHF